MKIFTEVILLTPEIAADFLKRNTTNRPVSEATVRRYMGVIARGEWELNGEPIIIFSDGNLGDGQHRCIAVCRTGIAIKTIIVKGVDPNAFATMNQGKTRKASDVLSINGQKNCTRLAAAARAYLGEINGGKTTVSCSPTQIVACIDAHPHITLWLEKMISSKKRMFPAMLAGYFAIASERFGFEKLDPLFESIMVGEGLTRAEPAYLLREAYGKVNALHRISPETQRAYIVKTINAHLTGAWPKILKYSPSTQVQPELISVISGEAKKVRF